MAPHAMLILTAGLILGADLPPEVAAEKALVKLQGTWTIVAHEHNGRAVKSDKEAKVFVVGNKFITKSGDKVLRQGSLKIDPGKKPHAIDVTYTDGPYKGKTLHGIFVLDGDTWRICYAEPGKDRPTELPKKAGDGQLLLVLQHMNP